MPLTKDQLRKKAQEYSESVDGAIEFSAVDPIMQRVKKYYIYIFSLFPEKKLVEKGSLGKFTIPACLPSARVSTPLRLPSVVIDQYFDAASQTMKLNYTEGEFVAQDIVHPFLEGMDAERSIGQNLDDFGIFWTLNEIPTEAELATARGKMEKNYRRQLENATQLETTGKLQFITPLMRLAATYFHENRPWNQIYRRLETCYACGGDIKAGVIIHSCGAVQPGMWAAAVKAGLKTKQQAEDAGEPIAEQPAAPASKRGPKV